MKRLPSLTKIVKTLNHAKRGSRFLRASVSAEWNEITLKLFESGSSTIPSATYYIDRGHTPDDRQAAACDAIKTAAMLLRHADANKLSAPYLLDILTDNHNVS